MLRVLLCLIALTVAAAGAAPPATTSQTNSTKGGKARIAGGILPQDLIIIIREPSATKPAQPVIEYRSPPDSSKPKELILDSLEDAERLAKSVKQQQPKADNPDADSTHEQQEGDSKSRPDSETDSPYRGLEEPEQEGSSEHDADDGSTHDSGSTDSSSSTHHKETEADEDAGSRDSSHHEQYDDGSSKQDDDGSSKQEDDGSRKQYEDGSSKAKEGDAQEPYDSSSYEQQGSQSDDGYRRKQETEDDGSSRSGSSHEDEYTSGSERQRQEHDADETQEHYTAEGKEPGSGSSSSGGGRSSRDHDSSSSGGREATDAGRRDSRDDAQSQKGSQRYYPDTDGYKPRPDSPSDADSSSSSSSSSSRSRSRSSRSSSDSSSERYGRRSQEGAYGEDRAGAGYEQQEDKASHRDSHHDEHQQQHQHQHQHPEGSDHTQHTQHGAAKGRLPEGTGRDYMGGLPGPVYRSPADDDAFVDPHPDFSNAGSADDSSFINTGSGDDSSSEYRGPDKYWDGGGSSSEGGPSPYPKMEEPAGYYEQPHLHTTCLQVVRAYGSATGPVTYDLRCCQGARDDPRVCMKPVEPYSPSNSYGTKLKLRDVIASSLKVGTCVFTPSTAPCPYSSGAACQAYDGSCVLSRTAADCGCPIANGLVLNITAYARSEAALSCNPVFSIQYTPAPRVGRRLLQANYTDQFAPYLGVATMITGSGESPDGIIAAGITMVTGFGVPAPGPAIGHRRRLTAVGPSFDGEKTGDGNKSGSKVTAARLASYGYGLRQVVGPRTRQLPTVFDPAPSAPLPLPDLPFVLGGRMIIQWSR